MEIPPPLDILADGEWVVQRRRCVCRLWPEAPGGDGDSVGRMAVVPFRLVRRASPRDLLLAWARDRAAQEG